MSDYKVYDNVERKIVKIKSGQRYLVDLIRMDDTNRCLIIGYESGTNKQYGWVEVSGDDPIGDFVSYIKTIDRIEKDDYIKEFERKHP